ncbi:MAG TPA: bb3-type cytochrome oxidase subunit III [Albitalea sp.]
MNGSTADFRADAAGRGGDVPGRPALSAARRRRQPEAVSGVALWVFIGVATTLFSLFIAAYVMRMSNADAVAIAMPRQLWLSTSLLLLGSVLLQQAAASAAATRMAHSRTLLLAAAASALAFVLSQSWAWQALLAQQVSAVGNPAGSFFYLLTALHGLHLLGGLAGWWLAARAAWRRSDPAGAAWRIALCARYWHFLLLAWLALFATFTWITPEVARVICRTA